MALRVHGVPRGDKDELLLRKDYAQVDSPVFFFLFFFLTKSAHPAPPLSHRTACISAQLVRSLTLRTDGTKKTSFYAQLQ